MDMRGRELNNVSHNTCLDSWMDATLDVHKLERRDYENLLNRFTSFQVFWGELSYKRKYNPTHWHASGRHTPPLSLDHHTSDQNMLEPPNCYWWRVHKNHNNVCSYPLHYVSDQHGQLHALSWPFANVYVRLAVVVIALLSTLYSHAIMSLLLILGFLVECKCMGSQPTQLAL